jgi:hypothetical protein
MDASVQVAYRATPAGRWPADYQLLDVAPSSDIQDDGRFLQESIAFTAVSSDPYYIIVQNRKGIGGISFLAQEGVAADAGGQARGPIWLLAIAGAAVAVALAALGMAVRARRRAGERVSG